MRLQRSRGLAGSLALALLFAGGCAPAGWPGPAEAQETGARLTVPGDIFDRPGAENACQGREIAITPGADGDTAHETAVGRGLIDQCRPALSYEELLYRYTLAVAERDAARRTAAAMAASPPPVVVAPEPYPAYSSGSAHPAAPVIYEQDMILRQPPVVVQPVPVYVSPPPPVYVAPPRPRPPHWRPPPNYVPPPSYNPPPASYRPPHHRPPPPAPIPAPPVVHSPPAMSGPPPMSRPPVVTPIVQPPPVHRPPPVVHQRPPAPPPAPPPAGSVGPPGQDRSTYGK